MRQNLRGAAFLLLLSLGACHVTFVTAYDSTFDAELTETQKAVDGLLSKIAGDAAAPYASFAADYAKANTDLDALAVRAGSHESNAETINAVQRLQHSFTTFQTEHANATQPLSPAHVRSELGIINHEFQILMAEELLKQSGK